MNKPSERALKTAREHYIETIEAMTAEGIGGHIMSKVEKLYQCIQAEAAPKRLSDEEVDKVFDVEFEKLRDSGLIPTHYPHWTTFLKLFKAGYRAAHGEEV